MLKTFEYINLYKLFYFLFTSHIIKAESQVSDTNVPFIYCSNSSVFILKSSALIFSINDTAQHYKYNIKLTVSRSTIV